jgi:PAS domain S-box-containing protein
MPVLNSHDDPLVGRQAAAADPGEPPRRPLPSEQRLRAIVETAPVGLVAVAETNRILAGNSAAMHLLGRQRLTDEVLKVPFDECMAPESRDAWEAYREKALEGTSERVAVNLTLPDGVSRRTMVQAAELPQKAGDPRVLLCALWKVDEPEGALTDAVAERDRLSARCDELLSELESLTQQGTDRQEVDDDNARRREEYELETARLRQTVESLQAELQAAQAAAELAKARIVDLSAGQGTAGDDRRTLEKLRVECDRLSDERQALIGVVESLRNELKASRESLGASEARLDERDRALEERRSEHEAAASERIDLARQNHELAESIRSLDVELVAARTRQTESEEAAHEAANQRADLARQNHELAGSMRSLEAELVTARARQTESRANSVGRNRNKFRREILVGMTMATTLFHTSMFMSMGCMINQNVPGASWHLPPHGGWNAGFIPQQRGKIRRLGRIESTSENPRSCGLKSAFRWRCQDGPGLPLCAI